MPKETIVEEVEETKIELIVDEFGREDLNRLRDTVNALIKKVD